MDEWPSSFINYSAIWIIGGDGTLNYFINHYPDIQIPLTLFKGGTGNDVHWVLYGEITLHEQVEMVLTVSPRAIDAGKCNDRLFINGIGIGFEGDIARATSGKKKLPGKTSFMLAVLQKIFFYRSQLYHIAINEKRISEKLLMVSVTNGKRAGGGFYVAPDADPFDGQLDLVMIRPLSILERARYLPVIEKGKHRGLDFVYYENVQRIQVRSDKIMAVHADGEFFPAHHLIIEILPERFSFLVPEKNNI